MLKKIPIINKLIAVIGSSRNIDAVKHAIIEILYKAITIFTPNQEEQMRKSQNNQQSTQAVP